MYINIIYKCGQLMALVAIPKLKIKTNHFITNIMMAVVKYILSCMFVQFYKNSTAYCLSYAYNIITR